ncbi:hypothetical protein [Fervidobacterium islandicum]|nr:hypothetical protein [Fervidobacterium islandicum]
MLDSYVTRIVVLFRLSNNRWYNTFSMLIYLQMSIGSGVPLQMER